MGHLTIKKCFRFGQIWFFSHGPQMQRVRLIIVFSSCQIFTSDLLFYYLFFPFIQNNSVFSTSINSCFYRGIYPFLVLDIANIFSHFIILLTLFIASFVVQANASFDVIKLIFLSLLPDISCFWSCFLFFKLY